MNYVYASHRREVFEEFAYVTNLYRSMSPDVFCEALIYAFLIKYRRVDAVKEFVKSMVPLQPLFFLQPF